MGRFRNRCHDAYDVDAEIRDVDDWVMMGRIWTVSDVAELLIGMIYQVEHRLNLTEIHSANILTAFSAAMIVDPKKAINFCLKKISQFTLCR